MNKIILFSVVSIFLFACNNNVKHQKPVSKTAYTLDIPTGGWTTERISFPISFAPGIHYRGTEDIRFTPGWGNPTADDYWTYEFLWWLNDAPVINKEILTQNLYAYYSGLVNDNVKSRSIASVKLVPVKVDIKKIVASKGDKETYSGTIAMLDYMTQRPMVLNCMIHLKSCTMTAIVFEMSPQPLSHPVWQSMDKLQANFLCGANG